MPTDLAELEPPVTTTIDEKTCREMITQYTTLAMRHDLLEQDELADIFLRRSTLHSCLGKHEDAMNDAQQSIALRPDQAAAYYRAGHACFKLHMYKDAAKFFQVGLHYSSGSKQIKHLNMLCKS